MARRSGASASHFVFAKRNRGAVHTARPCRTPAHIPRNPNSRLRCGHGQGCARRLRIGGAGPCFDPYKRSNNSNVSWSRVIGERINFLTEDSAAQHAENSCAAREGCKHSRHSCLADLNTKTRLTTPCLPSSLACNTMHPSEHGC